MIFSHLKLHSSLEKNLRLIAFARLALLLVAQFFVLLNQFIFAVEIQLFWAEMCLLLLALSAGLTLFQLKSAPKNLEHKVKIQLVSDVIILSLLFHVTGGAANPFVSILLFPLVISASILTGRFNWFMVLFTLSCYGSLFLVDTSVDHNGMPGHQHAMPSTTETTFSLHIIGMWFNFAISAVLISFFVVRMRQEIELQQIELNAQREQALRDEQLLGIATQAASAAHHLGTPLSTMSIIIHDLESDPSFPDAYKEDLAVLSAQVANCKGVLNSLRHEAENEFKVESLSLFITKLLDEFHLIRPQAKLERKDEEDLPNNVSIMADPALRMAILNVLNNAADVSPDRIIFQPHYQKGHIFIDIIDFGSGIRDGAGLSPVTSTKQEGLGLGLFLSHATINRYGGEISLFQLDAGGTRVRITIPLSA
jgi:two-component system sensor histidine kinase RegB